ncbi:hypothetical protein QYM36_011880 [Artemia franciscana]|uniref:Reverse transcriptase domain-containing protein n=1 Tax=Artemia franciscana TaxID=6661 RepID=A0AA88HNS9_ARTSF|nr:hypothetical protein QYM36_011880 [Artemia franciscana]
MTSLDFKQENFIDWNTNFKIRKPNNYQGYLDIFTDGSKNEGTVGAAFVVPIKKEITVKGHPTLLNNLLMRGDEDKLLNFISLTKAEYVELLSLLDKVEGKAPAKNEAAEKDKLAEHKQKLDKEYGLLKLEVQIYQQEIARQNQRMGDILKEKQELESANLRTLTNNGALDAKLHSLVNLCLANKPSEGATIINEILEEYFYKPTKPKGVSRFEGPMRLDGHQSRKAKRAYRRQQYARIQRLWKKNPSIAADAILDMTKKPGPVDTQAFKQFWTSVFERPSPPDIEPLPHIGNKRDVSTLWRPIESVEIVTLRPSGDPSPGPDGLKIVDCIHFGYEVLSVLFTAIYFLRITPKPFLKSRTVFLPKSDGATDPADFRPISIAPMLQRWLHRVIATHLSKVVDISPAQTAFSHVDGSIVNTIIINSILRNAKASYKSVYLLSLDVRKAFDSVSHHSIIRAYRAQGLPPSFLDYIESTYRGTNSILELPNGRGETSTKLTRGVKRGDPLSPILFNLVVDEALRAIPHGVGFTIKETLIPAIAYADDLVIVSSTKVGLQKSADTIVNVLKRRGVDIAPYGVKNPSTHNDLNLLLAKIKKAPLTPHQRLVCLKQFIIPRFTHQLTLSPFSAGSLAALDKSIRSSVRAFLDLPHDVPNAYLHARVCDGGLGVPELRLSIPRIRASRIARSIQKVSCFEPPHPFLAVCKTDEMDRHRNYLRKLVNVGETYAMSKAHYDKYHSNQLYKSIDGAALKGFGSFPLSQNWNQRDSDPQPNSKGSRFAKNLSSRLPHSRDSESRLDGLHTYTSESCKRHDRIRDIAAKWLDNEGFRVIREPSFTTLAPGTKRAMGRWRPDILAIKGKDGVIFDAQVRAKGYDLDKLHDEKLDKYRLAPGLIDQHILAAYPPST